MEVLGMNLKTVGGHTFCPELLSGGVIIDVGCRGYVFTDYFVGKTVFCIDPDEDVHKERLKWETNTVVPMHCAISNNDGESAIYKNGEGTVLQELDPDQNHPFVPCKTITIESLYEFTGTNVDILKLDCEGAEYMILGEGFKPIPKQISVEFHKHTVPDLHNSSITGIMERLKKHYNVYQFEMEERHGCGLNYWDVLFIRKDIDK